MTDLEKEANCYNGVIENVCFYFVRDGREIKVNLNITMTETNYKERALKIIS